jgi:hypothetical protein
MTIEPGKTVIPYGVFPEPHELKAAQFFNALGFDVEFLIPVYQKGIRTPDIQMNGILWEIKSPQSNGKHTIENAFRKAVKQSSNIIFDLRKIKMSNDKSVSLIIKYSKLIKGIRKLWIITKNSKLLDLKK